MTIDISDNDPRISYTANANGAQTVFAVPFEFFDNTDLKVYVAGVLKSEGTGSANYGVSGGAGSTGTVTFVSGVTASATVVITRNITIERVTDFTAGADINRAALNTQLDTLTAIAADLKDTAGRALQLTDFDAAASLVLPAVDDRKGKVLAFNETSGAVEAGPSTSAVQTVANNAAAVNLIGTADAISDINDLATSTNISNISSVAGIASNISTVAGIASDVTSVAGDATDIGAVAGKATEIGRLGTVDAVADLALLGTSTVVADIATVAGVASTMSAAASNASAAAASATAAANSAAAAATALDSFDDRYLGSKSSEPSVDNDGNALVSGALYFNSTSNGMKVYDGGSWINASSAGAVSLLDYEYTATAGQTTFSGSDNNSATLAYAVGNLIVTLNGIVLDNGSDYTATSGTSIVLASGAALNDHLAVVAFKSFTVADAVPASTGGTFAGNVAVTGNISVTGTVDGRDVAADGTKLDTNIPSSLGSAGQVLTVNPAGNAGAWVAASGGGEQTFTATGAVSNGDIVGLNGDGTISVMTRLAGSFVKINDDGFHYSASVAYDSANNKIVYLYLDDGNNDYPMVAIGTVSGSSISFGTPVQVASSDGYIGPTRCIFDSNAGKFVAIYTVYGGSNSGSAKCKVGTVSGTSCSFGSEATVQSGNSSGEAEAYDACYDSGSNKIIFFYITGTKAYINVGDISGTSISWGSRVDVGPAQVRATRVTYDSSANKVICTYLDVTTTAYTCYYRVCTVSGTSITLGTQGTVANSTAGVAGYSYMDIEYCSARNRLFVAGEFQTVGDVIYVGSLSGTTITFGTPISSPIAFSGGGRITMVDCPDINGVVLQYNYYYNNTFLNLTCAAGTNNPQAFSPKQITGDATTGTATYYYGTSLAYDTTANKVIFATINDQEDDNPTAVVYDPLVPDRWVGLAAEAISNGASGKVTIIGGINTGQSGLVAGVNYKVSNSSDTLTDTSGTVVGVATSASSIYLTKAEIL